jgi:kynurenine formamidase
VSSSAHSELVAVLAARIGLPRCRVLALPLRLEGADGSPVRAVALVD